MDEHVIIKFKKGTLHVLMRDKEKRVKKTFKLSTKTREEKKQRERER